MKHFVIFKHGEGYLYDIDCNKPKWSRSSDEADPIPLTFFISGANGYLDHLRRLDEHFNEADYTIAEYPRTELGKFNVYRQWGTKYWKSVETERDAWDVIHELPFGEGYEVLDEHGHSISEFIPF